MRPRQAFTIIELLVVISIIALLIALLLPSLAGARDRARYVRWKGYSHSLRIDQDLLLYFNFEEQSDEDVEVWNRAAGSALRMAREDFEPEQFNARFGSGNVAKSPQWSQGRWQGKGALDFDGVDDYADAGSFDQLNLFKKDKLSIVASFVDHGSAGTMGLINALDPISPFGGWGLVRREPTGREMRLEITSGDDQKMKIDVPATSHELDQWIHSIATYNCDNSAAGMKIFMNGKQASTLVYDNQPGGIDPRTKMTSLGSYGGQNRFFDGVMDEIAVFTREMSATEVAEMYTVGQVRKTR